MATVTPNFGWPVPTSTDLVKDGATAMEALGDAIDTSMVDLKGGTTGQVLAKASNTDMDFSWVAQDDSNAIQNSIVDAKGDLIAASAADTPARLAVGSNGTAVIADSTAATGLRYGRPRSPGVLLYKDTQNAASAATVTAAFQYEAYDTDGFHDPTTNNGRITIPAGLGGTYLVSCQWAMQSVAAGQRVGYLYVNAGTLYNLSVNVPVAATAQANINFTIAVKLSAGDYLEMRSYQDSGGNVDILGGAIYFTNFQATLIGE